MSIGEFFLLMNSHPWAYFPLFSCFAVVFVNGWTDGPNTIATLVMTRSMRPGRAVIMSAVLNFVGVLAVGLVAAYSTVFSNVVQTISDIVTFNPMTEADLTDSFIALGVGLFAVVFFSSVSTKLNMPSSESNELIGGLTGAAFALTCLPSSSLFGIICVSGSVWITVLVGFFASLVLGFFLGLWITKAIEFVCAKMHRGSTTRFFTRAQIVSAGLMSFVHGLQDGSKFLGVYVIITMMLGKYSGMALSVSTLLAEWWVFVPIAIIMFAGSCMGGFNIMKTLGHDMAALQKYQAFATDIAAFIGLLLATFLGVPVSTGSVKTTAIMGGGATRSLKQVHWDVAGKMVGLWILVFPLTAIIGFVLTIALAAIF